MRLSRKSEECDLKPIRFNRENVRNPCHKSKVKDVVETAYSDMNEEARHVTKSSCRIASLE